jgi:hypothetical protein
MHPLAKLQMIRANASSYEISKAYAHVEAFQHGCKINVYLCAQDAIRIAWSRDARLSVMCAVVIILTNTRQPSGDQEHTSQGMPARMLRMSTPSPNTPTPSTRLIADAALRTALEETETMRKAVAEVSPSMYANSQPEQDCY